MHELRICRSKLYCTGIDDLNPKLNLEPSDQNLGRAFIIPYIPAHIRPSTKSYINNNNNPIFLYKPYNVKKRKT